MDNKKDFQRKEGKEMNWFLQTDIPPKNGQKKWKASSDSCVNMVESRHELPRGIQWKLSHIGKFCKTPSADHLVGGEIFIENDFISSAKNGRGRIFQPQAKYGGRSDH